jgi:DNA repair protein RadC
MKQQTIKNTGPEGHRSRLKERFHAAGRKGLTDYELIELLLTYTIPRVDTKPTAKALLMQFKTIFNVLQQPYEEEVGEYLKSVVGNYCRNVGHILSNTTSLMS